jgi:hypothetical protein
MHTAGALPGLVLVELPMLKQLPQIIFSMPL